MIFKIVTSFAILISTSCQYKGIKKIPIYPISDPFKYRETFVATLKDGMEEAQATINDSIIFIVSRGQLFVYDSSHMALIADGRFGFIPPDQVISVDTPYFKFNFSKWSFIKDNEYELAIAAKSKGVDLNLLIQKVIKKDFKALEEFLYLKDAIDGAAAEQFYSDLWALINLFSDEELLNFFKSLKYDDRLELSVIMMGRTPLFDVADYYRLHYPKTLEKINN